MTEITINYFKTYTINNHKVFNFINYEGGGKLYIDRGTFQIVQELFCDVCGKYIPKPLINDGAVSFIAPNAMLDMCVAVLEKYADCLAKHDKYSLHTVDRILDWSMKGYYVSFGEDTEYHDFKN